MGTSSPRKIVSRKEFIRLLTVAIPSPFYDAAEEAQKIILADFDALRTTLEEFVSAIEATGGIAKAKAGYYVPVVDTDWIDLGEAYLTACVALGKEPKIEQEEL